MQHNLDNRAITFHRREEKSENHETTMKDYELIIRSVYLQNPSVNSNVKFGIDLKEIFVKIVVLRVYFDLAMKQVAFLDFSSAITSN